MFGQAATIVVSVTVVLGTLAIVCVGLRLYCRYLQKLALGLDDYLILIALALSTGTNVISDYVAVTTGVGEPHYTPTPEALVFALKCNFAGENANIACVGIVKLSVLIFYRRIFVQTWFQRANSFLIALVVSFNLAVLLAVIFSKWPVSAQWDPSVPYNVNNDAILITFAAVNMVFDIFTITLPLVALRSLQMRAQRKLFLSVIFTLGSLCVVASTLRLYYGVEYEKSPQTASSLFEVPFILNSLWANIEGPAFIIAACLLSFGPLYQRMFVPARYIFSLFSSRRKLRPTPPPSKSGKKQEEGGIRKSVVVVSSASGSGDPNSYKTREAWDLETATSQNSV